jgi:hypothetical protein
VIDDAGEARLRRLLSTWQQIGDEYILATEAAEDLRLALDGEPDPNLPEFPFDYWRTLIGAQVTVIMDRDDPAANTSGQLVGLSEDGQATVLQSDGMRHYVWPALVIFPQEP